MKRMFDAIGDEFSEAIDAFKETLAPIKDAIESMAGKVGSLLKDDVPERSMPSNEPESAEIPEIRMDHPKMPERATFTPIADEATFDPIPPGFDMFAPPEMPPMPSPPETNNALQETAEPQEREKSGGEEGSNDKLIRAIETLTDAIVRQKESLDKDAKRSKDIAGESGSVEYAINKATGVNFRPLTSVLGKAVSILRRPH